MNLEIEILLVDDNPTDALLTRDALEYAKILNTVHHVEDGEEAMAFLRREGEYANMHRPGIILLDLNMPRRDGLGVLREIKSDPSLRTIPVVVLTTSTADADVLAAYDLHANCYVVKPVVFDEFVKLVCSMNEFWFNIARLPPDHD